MYKEIREKFLSDVSDLTLGSFNKEWENLDDKKRCVLMFRCIYNKEAIKKMFKKEKINIVNKDLVSLYNSFVKLSGDYISSIWSIRNKFLYDPLVLVNSEIIGGGESLVDLTFS